MGLVISDRITSRLGDYEETNIEMEMGWLTGSGRDLVHVEIDGGLVNG